MNGRCIDHGEQGLVEPPPEGAWTAFAGAELLQAGQDEDKDADKDPSDACGVGGGAEQPGSRGV